jgi:PIN domain nuclease of toxin-antitoxin system
LIVLDTHAWLWWTATPGQLSANARRAIDEAQASGVVYVSSISTWEIAQLSALGRLRLSMELLEWVRYSEALPFLHFVPVDNAIAVESVRLPSEIHNDPADRIILATAETLGATLVTKDRRLREYRHARTIW